MKKLLALLLALCVMTVTLPALAEDGSRVLHRRGRDAFHRPSGKKLKLVCNVLRKPLTYR